MSSCRSRLRASDLGCRRSQGESDTQGDRWNLCRYDRAWSTKVLNEIHPAGSIDCNELCSLRTTCIRSRREWRGCRARGGGGRGSDLTETYREGVQLLTDGECKKAERKFRTVVKAVSRNPEANYMRGVALQCQGKHKTAVRYLKRALRYDDEMYAASEKLGISYM